MLKVIIADDERIIREAIAKYINWSALGLELVSQCANGIEAFNAILDVSPDIAILDIKMPGLSGLDIIKKITETDKDMQFILLSGYGEFEYAQTAMRYGVRHYLLKPSSTDEINACLKEVMAESLKRKKDSNAISTDKPAITGDVPASITDQIQKYVKNNLSNPNLTLKWISENVLYMNVDYVSKRFLKDTGERFSAFLTRTRVETAEKLLQGNPYEKVQYVSKMVGCGNNPQYFSQIFKKVTGMTPSQYAAQYASMKG